jgi:hypothetical protein
MFSRLKKSLRSYASQKPALDRFLRLHYFRNFRAARTGYPDWKTVLSADPGLWRESLAGTGRKPKVLVATSIGAHLAGTTLAALTLRGAEVHSLLCDSALPACQDCNSTWYPDLKRFAERGPASDLCQSCFSPAAAMYRELGVRLHRYSEYLTPDDHREAEEVAAAPFSGIKGLKWRGIAVGEHAWAGALRFFARADLAGEPQGEAVLRRYLRAAVLTAAATERLLERNAFDVAVFHHGIYVPQGLIGEVCRKRGVRVVNWNPAYRKKCFIFSHNETYHHGLMNEPAAAWENMPWDRRMDEDLERYLESRRKGSEDWIWFHEAPQFDFDGFARRAGIDASKPCVGLLTNVMWDAQLHYPANAFPGMREWILGTIDHFAKRPDLQLLIRVHPAEVRGTLPSRQKVVDEVRKARPALPKNVFLIPPEDPVSTYSVMEKCNAALIYGTKTGVELAGLGLPVIVAGEAWIRNKGITSDARTAGEYYALLDGLPLKSGLEPEKRARARKYAYHFFFRRMIPLEFMEPKVSDAPYRLGNVRLADFQPGKSRGLDVICDGILKGSEFIYPAESVVEKSGIELVSAAR